LSRKGRSGCTPNSIEVPQDAVHFYEAVMLKAGRGNAVQINADFDFAADSYN